MLDSNWKAALQQQFRDYAAHVASPGPEIAMPFQLKIDHTMDVCSIMDRIICGEKIAPESRERLFWLSALYHDVSRFEQLRDYGTFSDAASFDHGQRSAEIFSDFPMPELSERDRQIIADALCYHNKLQLPDNLDEDTGGPAKAIRDADKISILKIFIRHYEKETISGPDVVSFGLPDTPGFTDEIIQSAIRGEPVLFRKMKCVNDFKLHIYSWSNDINFPTSARILLEEKLYERARKFLPESPLIDQAEQASLQRLQTVASGRKD